MFGETHSEYDFNAENDRLRKQRIIQRLRDGQGQLPDLYQRLGVAQGASQEDIKKTYRQVAKENHPDLTKDLSPEVREQREEVLKLASEAYAVLKDQDGRQFYDELRTVDQDRSFAPQAAPASNDVYQPVWNMQQEYPQQAPSAADIAQEQKRRQEEIEYNRKMVEMAALIEQNKKETEARNAAAQARVEENRQKTEQRNAEAAARAQANREKTEQNNAATAQRIEENRQATADQVAQSRAASEKRMEEAKAQAAAKRAQYEQQKNQPK